MENQGDDQNSEKPAILLDPNKADQLSADEKAAFEKRAAELLSNPIYANTKSVPGAPEPLPFDQIQRIRKGEVPESEQQKLQTDEEREAMKKEWNETGFSIWKPKQKP